MIEGYAVIVGLVSEFSSSRGSQKSLGIAEFQIWLSDHNHEDIVQLLNTISKTHIFVKAYLNQQVPEIQTKLDKIIGLVEVIAGDSDSADDFFSGKYYLKGVLLFGLEHIIHSGLHPEDFEIAYAYIHEMIGEYSQYNKYELEKIIRECLQRKNAATHTLNVYFTDLNC